VDTGQLRLDGLIRFLRAALPGDFAATATVAREQELVEAYVALLNQRSARAVQLQVSVDPGAGGEQMPSMLLLPLIRWALAEPSVQSLRVRIGKSGEMLVIEVESDARKDAAIPTDEIASVRERIAQLYGEGAQLAIGYGRARLEIPRHAPQAPLARSA
jgi:LytS/YehU family sensor histidine kinase